MNFPLVSICIPAYRQPELLRRALQSVAEQSFRDFEVVITDDSPDDSVERVAGAFAPRFTLRYLRNPIRLGPPENWNESVRQSKGELVKILHHDDWFSDAHSLKEFVDMMQVNPQAALGFGFSWNCGARDGSRHLHAPDDSRIQAIRRNPLELFFENSIGAPSATIFRRNDFQPFDRKLKWVVDLEFYIRILRAKPCLAVCPKPLVCVAGDLEFRVTNLCLGNKEVEAYEWTYLYRSLRSKGKGEIKRLRHLAHLLRKHEIVSPADLAPYLKEIPVPLSLSLFMKLRSGFGSTSPRL